MEKTLLIKEIISLLKNKTFSLIENNNLTFKIDNLYNNSLYYISYNNVTRFYNIHYFYNNKQYLSTDILTEKELYSYLLSMNLLDILFIKTYIIKNSSYFS
jgi:hypothetical protein